ncbi:MAG: family 78 glycoside hydrolase catalytic domain [Verrucomicrobiia bacterium]
MSEPSLRARWIAPPGEKTDNCTFLARKRFSVVQVPSVAMLRICADSRYAVYLNGTPVGLGPAKGSHQRWFYDSHDVTKLLRPGENHLAAEVHCPVRATFLAAPAAPALYAEIEGLVETDATWDVRLDPSRRADAPLYTLQIGFAELRDFRKEPAGWETFSDGAEGWAKAVELAGAHGLGGRKLVPRDVPLLREEESATAGLVQDGCVPGHEANVEDDPHFADLLLAESHFQADLPRWEEAEGWRIVPSGTGRGSYAIVDFGREIIGSVLLDVEAPEGTILDVGYAESLQDGRVRTKRFDYRFADRYLLRAGRQRVEHRLQDRGFRFLQLVLRRFDEPVRFHAIRAVNRAYPLSMEAAFECDDLFLNRLWRMCADTMAACATDTFTDCPWREQAMWVCDTAVETPIWFSMTSDPRLSARCLRLAADGQLPNGLIPSVYPSDQKTVYLAIPALWTIALSEHVLHSGDLDLVRELAPRLERALAVYEVWRSADGLVPDSKEISNFVDWGYQADNSALGGTTAILNMLVAAAYERTAWLLSAIGDAEKGARFARKAREVVTAVLRRLWSPEQRRLLDSTAPRDGRQTSSQHPHAVGLYFGLFEEPHREQALATLLDPALVPAEFYYQFFVLGALIRNGRTSCALKVVRDLWGEMVRAGSPTVWEGKRGADAFSGCGSLCHGFSCAPLHFMQTSLLGVRPLRPGFSEFRFDPCGAGLSACRGCVPTPHGLVEVEWTRRSEIGLRGTLTVPEQTTAVRVDGTRLGPGKHAFDVDDSNKPLPLKHIP